jgi:hypothetical protein
MLDFGDGVESSGGLSFACDFDAATERYTIDDLRQTILPCSRRQLLADVTISLKTMRRAVSWESALHAHCAMPHVAKALSMIFVTSMTMFGANAKLDASKNWRRGPVSDSLWRKGSEASR